MGFDCRGDGTECVDANSQVCDGYQHCSNGADELNCGSQTGNQCSSTEFDCWGDGTECVDANSGVCDGKLDCSNGADEYDCGENDECMAIGGQCTTSSNCSLNYGSVEPFILCLQPNHICCIPT